VCRAQFWWFSILDILLEIILYVLEMTILARYYEIPWLTLIYILAGFFPRISVIIRRMHDIDKSGWYIFFPFAYLIMPFLPGTKGDNQYGPAPK
jgi:uncharacterized membrane protein YhaH (DUF805 family)